MKNLQFRLWDKKRKEMINLRPAELSDVQGAHIALAFEEYGHTRSDETESIEDYEVLQFTGLLDKNGKERWEGDIIKWFYGDYEKPCITVVSLFDIPTNNYGDTTEVEVIGNIYENPELWKK